MGEILSIREAAQLLGVSDDTVRRLIREDKRLKAFKVRGQYRIDKDNLFEVLKTPDKKDELETAFKTANFSASETAKIMDILEEKKLI